MSATKAKWLGYHIYLPWTGNEFLADFLPRLISDLKAENQIKRFFFIRYAEGGYHLRLRLQAAKFSDISLIENRLESIVRDFRNASTISASQVWLTAVDYSREEHYFGETPESVYAELINEQTSYLSMRMLAGIKISNYNLVLKFAASVYWLVALSSFDDADLNRSLAESRDFAEKNRSGKNDQNFSSEDFLRSLPIAIERMSDTAAESATMRRAARLLGRLKLCKTNGRFAATHAIHLYCNKLGFSMTQESIIYNLLAEIIFPVTTGNDVSSLR